MARVLQLQKLQSIFCCVNYYCGIQADGWQSLSYLKLHYNIKRLKSSTKRPFGEEKDHINYHHQDDYSKVFDAYGRHFSRLLPENNRLADAVRQESSCTYSSDVREPGNVTGSTITHINDAENLSCSDHSPCTGILSVEEVLESVREDLYESGDSTGSVNSALPIVEDVDDSGDLIKSVCDDNNIVQTNDKLLNKNNKVRTQQVTARDVSSYKTSYKYKNTSGKANKNTRLIKFSKALKNNQCSSVTNSQTHCENKLGIQTLSHCLQQQIFGLVTAKNANEAETDFQRSKEHLEAHGLWGKRSSILPECDLQLPKLLDSDLDQHFRIIAEEQCAPYKKLLDQLVAADLPCFPSTWDFTPGWTRYNPDGSATQVNFPECDAIVFDVEVCMREGNKPTLAAAVSDKYWYSWCSDSLVYSHDRNYDELSLKDLIPLETSDVMESVDGKEFGGARVVVGHNVSYDRVRVREQYFIERSSLRFVDTMSLHIAVSGLVSEQRSLLLKNKTSDKKVRLPWMSVGCQNNLNDIYKFYCHTKDDLEKSTRNVFVKGSLRDVREDFQNLMKYCASDVKATHMVLVNLLPQFLKRCSHPVTFSGMLEMGMTFLPVTQNWNKYVEASESEYHNTQKSLNEKLAAEAQKALGYLEEKKYEEDPWLWNLDWSVPKGRVKKLPGYPNWYRKLCQRAGEREGTPEPENMSTSQQIVPKLLRLTWNGFPLHHERKYGWGYLKPLYDTVDRIQLFRQPSTECATKDMPVFPVKVLYDMCSDKITKIQHQTEVKEHELDDILLTEEIDEWFSQEVQPVSDCTSENSDKREEKLIDIGIPGVGFVQLPHKNGAGYRVGNPLAKDFLNKIEDKTLSSYSGDIAELVLKTSKSISYWKNNRDRILSQMVLWTDHSSLPCSITSASDYKRDGKYGVILPMVITAGTITRRAVERTWMTASNAYVDRIGSELKAMIESPPGYKFVGADVDSQELWIAAVLGDAYLSAEHGATALGWMTLQGKKSDGTDMHSRTANSAGISRDHAKVINYGRIYGAGVKFIQRLLKQFNPLLSEAESKERAEKLFSTTKGHKSWYLNYKGEEMAKYIDYPLNQKALTRKDIHKMLRQARNKGMDFTFADVVENPPVWVGGSESHTFNCLEAIALSDKPKTPVLGARITRALEPYFVDDQFMTSRVNWVVQSSAVDYLHLLLVCMRWLFSKYEIKGRFCISIHDEVRYLVSSEDCYRAALALQIANLLTRSLFAVKLGFKDLPQSVAFFSGIDIDHVLRKEPHLDCITPSNPDGLMKGYGISPGVTLDIQQILQVTKGTLIKNAK